MLTADLCCAGGLVCVPQIVPLSIKVNSNSNTPSDSCEGTCRARIADFVAMNNYVGQYSCK